jgi:hypothetical protein
VFPPPSINFPNLSIDGSPSPAPDSVISRTSLSEPSAATLHGERPVIEDSESEPDPGAIPGQTATEEAATYVADKIRALVGPGAYDKRNESLTAWTQTQENRSVIQKRMKTHQESLINCDCELATLQERTLDADTEAERQENQIVTARVEASQVATQATPANDTAASLETWNAVMQKTIADNAAAQSKIKECRERAQQEKSTYEVQM